MNHNEYFCPVCEKVETCDCPGEKDRVIKTCKDCFDKEEVPIIPQDLALNLMKENSKKDKALMEIRLAIGEIPLFYASKEKNIENHFRAVEKIASILELYGVGHY